MAEHPRREPELAALLSSRGPEIAAAWAEAARRVDGSRYSELQSPDLLGAALRALTVISETAASDSGHAMEEYIAGLSALRLGQHFEIGQVIEGFLLLREVTVPLLLKAFPPGSADGYRTAARFDSCVNRMIVRFAQLYTGAWRRELLEHHRHADLMLRVVQTTSGSLELDQVLARVAEGMVSAVGVRYCGIYLLDPEQGLLIPHAAAGDLASIQRETFRIHSLDPRKDRFFGGVLERREPAVFDEGRTSDGISPETVKTFGLKSVLAVPIESGGRALGAAVVATFKEHHTFGLEEIELARGVANATALAIDNARLYEETRRRLAESQGLQRVAAALLEKQDLGEVLDVVCAEARQLTGAVGSAVFLLEEEGWLRVARSSGTAWPSYDGLPVDKSFTGAAVLTGMARLTNAPDWEPSRYPGEIVPSALLAVPLRVKGVTIGALDVINKPDGFSGEDLRVMGLFADQAAIAIENARLRRQVEQLAVVEERQRLAHELHDSVTQSLYSMGLFAEAAGGLIASGNADRALDHLRQLRETAHESLREMRLLIFELHPPVLENEGLVAALQARLDAVENRGGLQSKLLVEGDERLPIDTEEELYRIALEALNNVIKHARAQHVTVQLHLVDGTACLQVTDDGVGFDPVTCRGKGGLGLSGMEERAKRIDAVLKIHSAPAMGTRVMVTLGCAEPNPDGRQDGC